MTNEQQKAKELAELLNAFSEGNQLEFAYGNEWAEYKPSNLYRILTDFQSGDLVIRIKPETKRVPLTMQDLIDRINSHKPMYVKHGKAHRAIQDFNDETVFFFDDEFTYEQFMWLVWYDNTPCYKEVECDYLELIDNYGDKFTVKTDLLKQKSLYFDVYYEDENATSSLSITAVIKLRDFLNKFIEANNE